nr:NADH dehydrogenase subunit 6 [Chalcopteryx rutilans]
MMICMTIITTSMMFSKMLHPMSMGMILLTQTILTCMMMGHMATNAWFSYILFLVMLGGVLVLFIYMTSVASNELFQKPSYPAIIAVTMIVSTTTVIMLLITDPMMMINSTKEATQIWTNIAQSNKSMFNYPNNIMTTMAVSYLFLTLIVVVKMTELMQGPLRMSN